MDIVRLIGQMRQSNTVHLVGRWLSRALGLIVLGETYFGPYGLNQCG